MNHSHHLYLTLATDEYWSDELFCWLVSSNLDRHYSFDKSACCVSVTGPCSQMWLMTSPADTPPVKTWSLCSFPVMPSAVSWRVAWLLGLPPWHYSESKFSWISPRLMCPSSCFLPVCRFVGYRAGACTHGEGVVTALIVLFSPVPIALLLMGMVFFHSYPINERRSLQLQEQLTTDQWVYSIV